MTPSAVHTRIFDIVSLAHRRYLESNHVASTHPRNQFLYYVGERQVCERAMMSLLGVISPDAKVCFNLDLNA
jgi:hypothetical protein